jgi:hypothetical protein
MGAYTVIVGRLTFMAPPLDPDSGFRSGTKSGGVPGQIAIWTCPGEGRQTAARAPGAIASAELANASRQATNSSP